MSKIQGLRVLVEQCLSATADQIVEAVENMISGYEEEMFQSKREIRRQRKLLGALLQPEIRLNRISEEAQLNLSVWEEDLLTEQQQEWNSCPRQKNPESLQTERSHNEPLSSSQDRRPEDDTIHDIFTPQCEKNEHEIYKEEEEPLPVTPAEQMPIESSPGFSEAENDNDKDWRLSDATQDEDGDRSEEWGNSGQLCTSTAKSHIICVCVCGKSFHSKFSLVNHLEIHPTVCGLCGGHFEREEDFQRHLETHVNVKAEAVCDICGKYFANPYSFKIHMRSHMGEKPFRCKECGKSFNCGSNMTRHLRIHTGEKPYTCTTCSKRFNDRSGFKRHMRTHLQDRTLTVTTPVADDEDGNAEKDSTAQTSKRLRIHKKSHTGEELFICKECGKSFNCRSNMTRHLRIHTGEKPYTCTTCSKRFNDPSAFKRHMRTHLQDRTLTV